MSIVAGEQGTGWWVRDWLLHACGLGRAASAPTILQHWETRQLDAGPSDKLHTLTNPQELLFS